MIPDTPLLHLSQLEDTACLHLLSRLNLHWTVFAVFVQLLYLYPELNVADELGPARAPVLAGKVQVEADPAQVGMSDGVSFS